MKRSTRRLLAFLLLLPLPAVAGLSLGEGPGSVAVAGAGVAPSPPSCPPVAASDRAGSVLVYSFFESSLEDPDSTNTRLTVMNVGPSRALVRLILVSGATCTVVSDSCFSFQPNQSRSFLASDLAPGQRGYALAIQLDPVTAFPSGGNGILGSASAKLLSNGSQIGTFGAAAIPYDGGTGGAPFLFDGTTLTLSFDGVSYFPFPNQLALDHFRGQDTASTILVLNAIGGTLPSSPASLGFADIRATNQFENVFTDLGVEASCQHVGSLLSLGGNQTLSAAGGFEAGQLRIVPQGSPPTPIFGAILSPKGGHNLRNVGLRPATLSFCFKPPCVRDGVPQD